MSGDFRLPDGGSTTDAGEYVAAWSKLISPFEELAGVKAYGFDPGALFYNADAPERSFDLPTWAIKRIIEGLQRQAEGRPWKDDIIRLEVYSYFTVTKENEYDRGCSGMKVRKGYPAYLKTQVIEMTRAEAREKVSALTEIIYEEDRGKKRGKKSLYNRNLRNELRWALDRKVEAGGVGYDSKATQETEK